MMVLVVFLLIFTNLGSLQSRNFSDHYHQFDLLESWGISRVKRAEDKIKERFPETTVLVCDMLHVTEETPFTAIVLFKTSGRLLCMGSIIDRRHILSAKRCYERSDVGDILVLVGYYKAYWGRHSQVLKVKKVVRHEYEVAILRLARNIKFTEYIQPVRLPSAITKTEKDFEKVFPPPYQVVGFVVDRYDVPGDYIEKDKTYKIKEDKLVKFDECKSNYTKFILDPPKLFCTMGNATYCWGGWGGPILKWHQNTYFLQVGVVVADNCTADTTGPFLAVRTDAFAEWIRGNSFHGHQPT